MFCFILFLIETIKDKGVISILKNDMKQKDVGTLNMTLVRLTKYRE